jgi:NADP-dependent 3-hydroxy acid dehydrogenase YdfG
MVLKMNSDKKKVAIVTGGSSGIGLCVSEFLLKKNYKVVILDIAVEEVLKHLEKEIKEKDVLVNNAGINA